MNCAQEYTACEPCKSVPRSATARRVYLTQGVDRSGETARYRHA